MWTSIGVLIGMMIVVILATEFASPPRTWKESHRRVKQKSVRDGVE